MRLGVTTFVSERTMPIGELAAELECRGYDSLYVPEHTHLPLAEEPPALTEGVAADDYRRCLDPLVALTAAAAATTRLAIGSGISLVAQHHPLDYAKAWATLDVLSAGRARFGVGFGWNRTEMGHHGVDYATRRERAREHVLAMHRLWRDDAAEFHGRFVGFGPSWSWPKPVQRPRIPTFVGGGAGPKLFAAVAEWADGWMPIGGAGLSRSLAALGDAWAAAGRDGDPEVIPFSVIGSPGKLERYRELGCTETVLRLAAGDRDATLAALDTLDPLVELVQRR